MSTSRKRPAALGRARRAERARRQARRERAVLVGVAVAGVVAVTVVVILVIVGSESKPAPPVAGSQAQLDLGHRMFLSHCAQCHGRALEGGPMAPKMVSTEFASLPDDSYRSAITDGVPNRRPAFGPMPPQGLSSSQADAVIAYIRGQQHAAGLS